MRLGARNSLTGNVVEVVKGPTTARVKIDAGETTIPASIMNEAVNDGKLAVGDTAYAIIKASSAIVATD